STRDRLYLALLPGCVDDPLHLRLRQLLVGGEAARVCRAPLGEGAQRGRILVHLRLWHERLDGLQATGRFDAENSTPPLVQVTDHVAQVLVGSTDLDLEDRLENDRTRVGGCLLESHR